ncbi:MAG: cell division septation protein DedD [Saprospiraceae bacterium]|jgi:cell division septation protein DedD
MNKPTTTAIYSLFVMLVFFGMSAAIQSCGEKKAAEESTEDLAEKVEDLADSYSEDEYFEDDDSGSGDASYAEGDASATSEPEEASTPRSYSNSAPTTSYSASSSTEPYLIVAGNYLLEDNAESMIKELKRKGYQEAEKVVFDLSQYHTVIAGRYSSRSAATSAAGELKRAGVDNYVIKKK